MCNVPGSHLLNGIGSVQFLTVRFEDQMQDGHSVSREETIKVKKMFVAVPVAIFFLMTAALAHATDGCVDSPENPTVVFGLIAAAASLGLMRFRKRSGPRDK